MLWFLMMVWSFLMIYLEWIWICFGRGFCFLFFFCIFGDDVYLFLWFLEGCWIKFFYIIIVLLSCEGFFNLVLLVISGFFVRILMIVNLWGLRLVIFLSFVVWVLKMFYLIWFISILFCVMFDCLECDLWFVDCFVWIGLLSWVFLVIILGMEGFVCMSCFFL